MPSCRVANIMGNISVEREASIMADLRLNMPQDDKLSIGQNKSPAAERISNGGFGRITHLLSDETHPHFA